MSFDKPAVVIDNGSYFVKAGFACDNHPVAMFRAVVGRPGHLRGYGRATHYDVFIGDEAITRIDDYSLNSPVVNGRIVHWDNMERVWHHIFYRELKAAPEDRAVILACSPTTPMAEKIKTCQVFFEVLNAPAVCIQPQSVLALYGSGFTTGVSVDIGYDTSDICPVYEGGPISYAHMDTGIAAAQVSAYLNNCFIRRDIYLGSHTSEIVDDIMKQHLYITQSATMSRTNYQKLYTLPDGETIDVSEEAFMAGELLYQPDMVINAKTNWLSLHEAIITACMKCDSDLRSELYGAIVMAGGLSTIPGVHDRLAIELEGILKKPVNVVSSEESHVVPWLGAAIFAGLHDARKLFVTKTQFEENGARIVRNKFI